MKVTFIGHCYDEATVKHMYIKNFIFSQLLLSKMGESPWCTYASQWLYHSSALYIRDDLAMTPWQQQQGSVLLMLG